MVEERLIEAKEILAESIESEKKAFIARAWELQAQIDGVEALLAEETDIGRRMDLGIKRGKLRAELQDVEDKADSAAYAADSLRRKIEVMKLDRRS